MRNLVSLLRVAARARRSSACALVLACAGAAVLAGSTAVTRTAGAAAPAGAAASGLARLAGHVHGQARPQFDVGRAPDSLALHGLEIVFAQTPAQQQALEKLAAAQQDPKSPQFHQWLTPAEYGARFGASASTVAAVTRWLTASGFSVGTLPANRSQLPFSGTKAQVETAFHTEIHLFEVDGRRHYANVSDPEVPAGLAPAILAIHGLHDFYPKPNARRWSAHGAGAKPQITYDGGQQNWIGPGDFAAMYNIGPLYAAGINGTGVTIAIGEQSAINPTVADTFWAGVGITTPPTITPMTVPGGTDPGQTMDTNEEEAYLDIEVAGGVAPGATLALVADTNVVNAIQYIIQQKIGQVVSISFSTCESANSAAANASIDVLFREAVTQGQTVVVASDDAGVEGCEANPFTQGTLATTGFAVSGLAASPHALAVGGTDFDPTIAGPWNTTNAPGTLVNAQGHVPEMVWNDTCANPVFAKALGITSIAFCNEAQFNGTANVFLQVAGSGSGVSSCTSTNSTTNACTGGYPVPSWQSGVAGTSNLTGRAVPDVAVAAGGWVICSYDNATCDPANANAATNGDVDLVGGTSSSTPAVAAIIALLDQQMGSSVGLINPTLYQLAAAEYGTPASPNVTATGNCNASLGLSIGADCVFYNITAGSSAMPCTVATYNDADSAPPSTCGGAAAGETNGIMELNGARQYTAGSGFNLATGLGSINAANLVLGVYLPAPSGLAAAPSGQSVQLSWTADTHAATYNVYQASASGQEGTTPVQTAVAGTSATVTGLQFATTYYFTVAAVAALGTSRQSGELQTMTVPAAPAGLSAMAGNATASLTWTAVTGAASYNVYQGTSAGAESATPVLTGISGVTANASGLTNGTTYYFKVAAVDAGGASALSNEASAMPVAPAGGHGGGSVGMLEAMLLAMLALL
ncbi:MAG TPA: protease pro-enzyme activation domain-containing protein, partial [Steroidobacteraceae bacterium]|nr:protease pro-enzyme activation domain-containing protein [Steroidobacteraceae bacterium]